LNKIKKSNQRFYILLIICEFIHLEEVKRLEEKKKYNKFLVLGIFVLFSFVAVSPIMLGEAMPNVNVSNPIIISGGPPNNGTLSGYVKDINMNPIEGVRVRVSFHETYEQNYSDENGYYHVTNIPMCYCMKNASCYKPCYSSEWVMLAIVENTIHDFTLNFSNRPPSEPIIKGPKKEDSVKPKYDSLALLNYPPGIYDFTFKATDPDGDNIRFHIDWGDGTTEITEFVNSGEELTISHSIEEIGNITIKAMAEDVCGLFGPESTIDIPIPKNNVCGCPEGHYDINWDDFCNSVSDLAQMLQDIINEKGGIFKLLSPVFASLISIWMIFCWFR
jgi:hypothetical protein